MISAISRPFSMRNLGVTRSARANLDHSRRSNELVLHIHFAGFDLAKVQDVIDDGKQRVPRVADNLGKLVLIRRSVGYPPAGTAHADHGVHRCADLVTHRGEERVVRGSWPVRLGRGPFSSLSAHRRWVTSRCKPMVKRRSPTLVGAALSRTISPCRQAGSTRTRKSTNQLIGSQSNRSS